jgi:hypothetical protein
MSFRLEAIYNTHSSASRTNDDGAYDINDNLITLDEEKITIEETRLQAEYDAQSYVRNRVDGVSGSYAASQGTGSIYPSTGEQFDMLYHELETSGSLTVSGSWFNVVKAVKDANPKP